jgi:ubiquinone/menaquinone biosynthesis C-methylase UbiE
MAGILEQVREIKEIWSAFQSSRALITANNYRIFDYLEESKTSGKLAKEINTDKRATEILLDALTGIGLLNKKDDEYKNTKSASGFLVSGSLYYQGDIIRHADSMWKSWSNLDSVLTTGNPSRGGRNHEAFILGMHNLASLKSKKIIQMIGLKGVKKALDLGGGPGTYAVEMAKKGVHVTLFDTPETIKIAKSAINRSLKDSNNIDLVQGDFLTDSIGKDYDLIFMSQIVHSYSEKTNISLLKKCRKAIRNNGRIVIQDFMINENRTKPVWSALFAINMLVHTEGGRTYSPGDMKEWLLKTGFSSVRKNIVTDGVLISARK